MGFRPNVGIRTFACAVAVLLPCSAVAQSGASQTFRVESQTLSVGPVTAGTVATIEFVFHNEGDREVEIIRAAPS